MFCFTLAHSEISSCTVGKTGPYLFVKKELNKDKGLCNFLEPLFISLYFAWKLGISCIDLLKIMQTYNLNTVYQMSVYDFNELESQYLVKKKKKENIIIHILQHT